MMLCVARLGRTSIGVRVRDSRPQTTMKTINRLAATPLRANQPIIRLMARNERDRARRSPRQAVGAAPSLFLRRATNLKESAGLGDRP